MGITSGSRPNVLCIVLAGGEGRRLHPLTSQRAKPAVPFGGRYRLVDIVLSNLVNSGFAKVKVLTQYKSDSLNIHLNRGWRLSSVLDEYVEAVPAQQRLGKIWFRGSADAIHQSLNVVKDEEPDYVVVFGADHIYKMDVGQMLDFHIDKGAELTVSGIPVPVEEASEFGVMAIDEDGRLLSFTEKPSEPQEMPGRPGWSLVSMGNYIFNTDVLTTEVARDALDDRSNHDFGRDIIPKMVGNYRVFVYDFSNNFITGQPELERGYWRDVGTIESYWEANMDLVAALPVFDLYNPRWPIRSWRRPLPPAKFVFSDEDRMGVATNSLVSEGCIISGGRIDKSVLAPEVRINSYAQVDESILLDRVSVGRHTKLRRVIVDKNVHIPPHQTIGYDLVEDAERFTVSDGIVVIPKAYEFE